MTIRYALQISGLTPLNQFTRLKKLKLFVSRVSDLSVLSSMPLLEEVDLDKRRPMTSIKDLSPLIQCKKLRVMDVGGNRDIEDLSPLAQCTHLEKIWMTSLTKITDLKPLASLNKLNRLSIDGFPVEDVTPLSGLQELQSLYCHGIPETSSLLPLARCSKLKKLYSNSNAKERDLLRERRPNIHLITY